MALDRSDLYKRIGEDAETFRNNGKVLRAGFFEKMLVKKVPPEWLHANPDDEFSDPNIGPNDSIVGNYCSIARRNYSMGMPVYEEPIYVNKVGRKSYLILNGHHRWAGAIKAYVPKVRIAIVNPGRK